MNKGEINFEEGAELERRACYSSGREAILKPVLHGHVFHDRFSLTGKVTV